MKLTKTITALLLGTLCMTALCSCSSGQDTAASKKKNADNTKDTETTKASYVTEETTSPSIDCELPEGEVLIHTGYTNEAEGYNARNIYVLSDGSVYMSEEFFGGFVEEYCDPLSDEDRLSLLKLYTKPVMQINEPSLLEIYYDMVMIDPDAEFVYEDDYVCYDAGYSYTEVNVGGNWIKISEGGVYNGWLEDDYAKEASELIRDSFSDYSLGITTHIYSKDITFLKTFELTCEDPKPCKMLITNMDELKAFEEQYGIDLESLDSFAYFGDRDYDSFKSLCIAVEIVAYDEVFGLDTVSTDAFIVSDNYVGFGNLGLLKMATTDLRLGVDKYYCYVAQVPAYDMSVYDGYTT
ncbi:MAG: hypothetical protein IK128_01360 [Clostridiales bacterium]|nr:hypothetical protein [Clostridiales bacterium]